MRVLFSSLLSLALLYQPVALAETAGEALGACLADNTSGKDRKDLARWIFTGMAAHPEIRDLSSISDRALTDARQTMGVLVTRLLSDSCAVQARKAIAQDGNAGVVTAFKVLGELAMQELMSNKDVAASIGAYAKYLDQKKIDAALSPK